VKPTIENGWTTIRQGSQAAAARPRTETLNEDFENRPEKRKAGGGAWERTPAKLEKKTLWRGRSKEVHNKNVNFRIGKGFGKGIAK